MNYAALVNSKFLLFLISAIFLHYHCCSQNLESLRAIYKTETIYRSGSSFIKGGNNLRFADLEHELSDSKLGLEFFLKSKSNRTASKILRIVSIVSIFTIMPFISDNRNATFGFVAGNFILNGTSTYYTARSDKYIDQAIWYRNAEVLFPQR